MALQGNDVVDEAKLPGFTFRGRDIILSKTRGRPLAGIKKRKGYYDDTKRIEVATLYAVIGDPEKISELTSVPIGTIRDWRSEQWFRTLLEEIKDENNEKLDSKFTEIVHKSQDLLMDRLDNGDFTFNREGSLVRKPVSARDLALVGAITVDKRQIIRKEPTSISKTLSDGQINKNSLQELAKQFVALTQKTDITPKEDITDVEYQEVVGDGHRTPTDQSKGSKTPAETKGKS
jgi:hypothetical protein